MEEREEAKKQISTHKAEMEKREEARKQILTHKAEIERLEAIINTPTEKELEEKDKLQPLSYQVTCYLLTCLIVSILALVALIAYCRKDVPTTVAIASIAGFLGSSVSALLSINQRVANGWEFSGGGRMPDPDMKKERFNARMVRGFVSRPFVGVVGGLLVFFGCVSNVLWSVELDNTFELTFWCLLGGLFAKTLLEKLKDVFKSFLGK